MSSSSFSPKIFAGFHCVGWISSAHGIRGELFVRLYAGVADWQEAAEDLFLLPPSGTDLKKFKKIKLQPHKDGLIARLEGVDDRTLAETFTKAGVYVREEILQSPPGEPVFLKQIEGFEVTSPRGEVLGRIVGFASNGPQDLLRVQTASGEALVPLVDAFLVHIDFDKQQVTMDLPPGLLNLEEA